MLRNRTYLIGLGTGLIVGAMLLQLMIWSGAEDRGDDSLFADPAPAPQEEPLDEASLRDEAKRLGLQVLPGDEPVVTEREAEERARQAVDEALREAAAKGDAPMVRALMITPGMTSDNVAELLLELGLIRSKLEFNEAMKQLDLNRNIQTGVFLFTETPEVEQLIQTLTTPR